MTHHSTVRRSPTFHLSPVAGTRIGGTGANDGNGNWASAGQKMLASAATRTVALGAFNMRSVDGDEKMATLEDNNPSGGDQPSESHYRRQRVLVVPVLTVHCT